MITALFVQMFAIASVLRVAPSGAPYTTPQTAIDAAVDGDTILIAPGTYPGFAVHDEALSIAVDPPGTVQCGAVLVDGMSAAKNVLIASLTIHAQSGDALAIQASAGSIRIQDCTLRGSNSVVGASGVVLGSGAYVTGSNDVVLRACTIEGGNGGGAWLPGADGLFTRGSRIALQGCNVRGGAGGYADSDSSYDGGRGGDGLETPSSFVLAQRTSFQGGNGGDGGDGDFVTQAGAGGAGGDGIRLYADAPVTAPEVITRECTTIGGSGGLGGIWGGTNGANGAPTSVAVGTVRVPAQSDVLEVVTPVVWTIGAPISIAINAPPGTIVSLYVARNTAFVHNALTDYALHLAPPLVRRLGLGAVPPSGTIAFNALVPSLPVGIEAQTWYLQAVVIPAGAAQTSSLACAILRA